MGGLTAGLATLREAASWFVDRWFHEGHPESLAFDAAHGVDTAGWTLDTEPVLPSVCAAALDALPEAARRADFVDLGCGKGRALLIAADRGFPRVVGVEHVASLCLVALRNAAIWRAAHPEAPPIDVLHADASQIELPRRDLVLFLYNPFAADVLGTVLDRVSEASGRRVWAIYVNPLDAEQLDRRGWSILARGGQDEWAWRIYTPGAT